MIDDEASGRVLRVWIAAVALCAFAAACDFDVQDIKVDPPHAAQSKAAAMDAGPSDAGSDRVADAKTKPDPAPSAVDAPPAADDERPVRHAPRTRDTSVEGRDSDTGVEDRDTGVDDGDARVKEPIDPCTNGTFLCERLPLQVYGDFVTPPAIYNATSALYDIMTATVTVTVEGYTLSTQTNANGAAELLFPRNRWVWMRTTADGFWTSEMPVWIASGPGTFPILVFTSTNLQPPSSPAVDESKGFVIAAFDANLPGAGIDIGRASGPPYAEGSTQGSKILSPTMVTGSGAYVDFPDVELGSLTPVPYGPPGQTCFIKSGSEFAFEAKPKTALFIPIHCDPTTP